MTSTPNASFELLRSRDGLTNSPLQRRTTSSTFSGSTKGYSVASSDAGESSTAASKRNSFATTADENMESEDVLKAPKGKDGRGSHRSHRSRNSGGFLLSHSTFEPPASHLTPDRTPDQRHSPRDHKGKAAIRSQDKKHIKRKSNIGLGIGGSPLSANVTSAAGSNGVVVDQASEDYRKENGPPATKAQPLDADSAQIVNLALNLSESRRNAARRNVSSPLPPLASTFGEGFAGGSLRQHLQQQRRVSRNISPKPQRASNSSPRGPSGQNNSPLNANFDSSAGGYQYHFTPSTLARAEKAKNQIELMYQYRRLLQYLPPLKPQGFERSTILGSPGLDSPTSSRPVSRTTSSITPVKQQIGREYNPLQYIRNRKVRARERKAIDGEAQGFGNLEKVSSWVDDVSKLAESQSAELISIPVFSKEAELAASPHTSPGPHLGKTQATPVKIKRPRIDWEVNPADMLADVFWLEQDGNKTVVEDRFGRKIFPQTNDTRRPTSRSEEPQPQKTPEQRRPLSPDLRIDTKLPEFRSMKAETDRHYDSTTLRVRDKIRDATRIHHGHNGSAREAQQFLRARSRSSSDSSDTDGHRRSRRSRSGTVESSDRARDILEKQMLEMLAREARENRTNKLDGQRTIDYFESQKTVMNEQSTKSRNSPEAHIKSGSTVAGHSKRDSIRSSGRASLEVPGGNPRRSLEELDSTAPNSPQIHATKVSNAFVPSIAMDLSPPQRQASPSRNPLSRVKSKMNPFEHARARSRGRADTADSSMGPLGIDELVQESPETPERRKRSTSPIKIVMSRRTDDSSKTSSRGSIRRGKTNDETFGIRGLFKGPRGPVARVSDFLWKKEAPVTGTSSGFSTDESDVEDVRASRIKSTKGSRESSIGDTEQVDEHLHRKDNPSYLNDMPNFTSSFDGRGRTTRTPSDEIASEMMGLDPRQARDERRKTSRANFLEKPPRIDIQNASPASSPDLKPVDSYQGSDISDFDSQRGNFSNGVKGADARLNYILGTPGHHRQGFPVTGLYNVEASRGSRPSLEGNRQWSISDRGISSHRGPMTKREIARVKALLLSSGIKAKEIARRAAEIQDLHTTTESPYMEIAKLAPEKVKPTPKSQEHLIAARILSDDIQLSKQVWQASADVFCNTTVQNLIDKVEHLQSKLVDNLTPLVRKAADEADEVSKDLVTRQTLKVKQVTDTMDKMLRRRRRKLRWLRRGGWVIVEWALVGVMWMVWFLVVFVRIIVGVGKGVVGATRWLLWL